ncbi:MAG: hypothetical protein K2W96_08555 [Gemmataceae bacterium]|nr:hypothetical protein [Gemmataceae bacterium]
MPLPPSLLQHVEQHACFTGCYGSESNSLGCLDPARPPQPLVVVSCLDCLGKLAVPQALLPAGTTSATLAQALSDHLRIKRGYALARSGYHAVGPGFWLGVAYYGCGLFLLSAERSRSLGTDLDMLMLALKHKLVPPPDPRMNDPKLYRTETVHVNFSQFQAGIAGKAQLLASPQASAQAKPGWQKATLAEFLPLAAPPTAAPAVAKPPALGDTCPKCRAKVAVRPLLNGSFIGCLC